MAYYKKKEYIEEGVSVLLQKGHKGFFVERKDLKPKAEYPATPNVFDPYRLVINIALFKKSDPDKYLSKFKPKIKLRVGYERDDLRHALLESGELKLAYWKEKTKKWVPIDFEDENDPTGNWAGYGVAEISELGDPPIAWGT